ncbi:glycosyltransferase [Leifsonia sp. A12D58]|uniref:glycosyltransferase n=1 Tax=Leifsonia sp. A12D58 TaxID=3397674 RepID=UPI0039E01C1C
MQPRVTAILVARNGAKHLERTLEALAAQTRTPDTVIVVDCGSTDSTSKLLAESGPTHFLSADADLTFGQAIAIAVRVTAPPESDNEMLWLLAQDSAPEADALANLLGELEIAPSVAVAGPKIMEWDAADYIHEFGESITPFGATVTLVENELDQAQHDSLSDVMAVAAGGMLVRHTVWDKLGGFDPGLPVVDDSLDFCIRVRLAGYRVSVVAAARVSSAGDGVAGPNGASSGALQRKRVRAERAAQLHRRLVYAPAWALLFHWLSLVPLAIIRSIWQLLRKEPGAILGEFSAAFAAAFNGMRVSNARKKLAATKTLSWAALAPLRVPSAEVRRRTALRREASAATIRGLRPEIHFFATGGAWTIIVAAVAGIGILAPLLGANSITGGGLLPLSDSVTTLWQNAVYGWRDIGLGFVGAADPFAAIVAVLGSLTFWDPSFSLVLLYLLALPLAAFGAWMATTRLTQRGSLRAVMALLWVLSPPFLTALATGRPADIIVHLMLPWLIFAGLAAARSWSASASAALLFAVIVACSPSLAPALLVGWLICLLTSGRSIMRFIGIPLPALALSLPLIWDQTIRGNWLALIADPGAPIPSASVSAWQLLMGFPTGDLGGWSTLLASVGIPLETAQIAVPALLAPLALLALAALFLPGSRSAVFSLVAALLGFGTAVVASHIAVATVGSQDVGVWTGSALSLYWLGIIGAVLFTLRNFTRFALLPALVTSLAVLVVSAPLAASMSLGTSVVSAGSERTLPAFVSAEAQTDQRVGTLIIEPQPDGGILATIERGAGVTLDDQSTLASTAQTLTSDEEELAELAGNLVSRSGLDATGPLSDFGVSFVLLRSPALEPALPGVTVKPTLDAETTELRANTALNGNAALVQVGETAFGQLWRHEPAAVGGAGAIPADAGGLIGLISAIVALTVIGATVLLSIPTGAGREAVRQANREAIRQASRASARQKKAERARATDATAAASGAADDASPSTGSVNRADSAPSIDAAPSTGSMPANDATTSVDTAPSTLTDADSSVQSEENHDAK